MTADMMILLVTWYRAYVLKRHAHNAQLRLPLISVLLRDGTAYFLILLFLNVFNVIGYFTGIYLYTVTYFATPLSSIIITHFLLNLRQAAYNSDDDPSNTAQSYAARSQSPSLRFASFVGNMGEQLDYGTQCSDPDMTWLDEDNAHDNVRADISAVQCGTGSADVGIFNAFEDGLGSEDYIENARRSIVEVS
ncbi:hypothetical protein OBBRIDRAFT_786445 [Obba rivulosa]|uniref:Uncharacterized protein n=1 Tax=Obba rivulosa TaxID=1052685 RepID=A0A8E2DES3_9APHY|nr:hypothetical protein OBBRIDRAFT_786445 [Obba rivulosa]